MVEFLLNYLIF